MKNFLTTQFNGKNIATYLWNEQPCWIAIHIVNLFDYFKPSKIISHCAQREAFKLGVDYDILSGDALRRFKVVTQLNNTDIRYAPKLVIFYESGLYGFLNYCDKPQATPFKSLVRHEILPKLFRDGYYIITDLNVPLSKTPNSDITENIVIEANSDITKNDFSIELLKDIRDHIKTIDIPQYEKLNLLINLYESLGNKVGKTPFINKS